MKLSAEQRLEKARQWAETVCDRLGDDYWKQMEIARERSPSGSNDRLWRAFFLGWLFAPPEALELTSLDGGNPLPAELWENFSVAQELYQLGIQARTDSL